MKRLFLFRAIFLLWWLVGNLAVSFAASAVLSFIAGMAISLLFFKKANFKAYVTAADMIQR